MIFCQRFHSIPWILLCVLAPAPLELRAQALRSGQLVVDLEAGPGAAPSVCGCGDIDGDGWPDLVFARTSELRIYWGADFMSSTVASYLRGALARPPLHHVYSAGALPGEATAVALADVDGNGWNDVLIAGRGTSGQCGKVLVLLQTQPGVFGIEHEILPPGAAAGVWVGAVVAADFDLDGVVEIVLGGYYDPIADTVHAPPGSGCPPAGVRTAGLWRTREIEIVEYDPVALGFTKRLVVRVNNGIWGDPLIPYQPGSLMAYGSALAVGDFNGDGFPDLAVGDPGASDRIGSSYTSAFNDQPRHPDPFFPGTCVPQSGMLDIFLGEPEGPGNLSGVLGPYKWLDGWDLEDRCITDSSLTMQAARHASALAFADIDGNGCDELFVTAPGWRGSWGGNAANAFNGQGRPAPVGVDARLGVLEYPIRKAVCGGSPQPSSGIGELLRPSGTLPVQEDLQAQPPWHTESVGVSIATGHFGGAAGAEARVVLGNPFLGIDPAAPHSRDRQGEISVVHSINLAGGARRVTASWYDLHAPPMAGGGEFTRFGRQVLASNVNGSTGGAADPGPDELICSAPGLITAISGARYRGAVHILYQGDALTRFGLELPAGSSAPLFTHSASSSGFGEHLLFSTDPALLTGTLHLVAATLLTGYHSGTGSPACWPWGWWGDPVGQLWWETMASGSLAQGMRLISLWPDGMAHQSATWSFPWPPSLVGTQFTLYFEIFDLFGAPVPGCGMRVVASSNYLHLSIQP